MRVIEAISELGEVKKGCVLTIGNFDGVHIGHQEILAVGRQLAAEKGTELVIMTFQPHPLAILYPEKAPRNLTYMELKKHLLAEFGVDCLLVVESSPEFLALSPADFVGQFLAGIYPSVVVEGERFNFGYRRSGNIDTLVQLAGKFGFEVSVIKPREVKLSDGQTVEVSSTLIRNLLEAGRVADAFLALGRPYRLIGQVVLGSGRAKKLGFPTANIKPVRQIVPAEGVYAGLVEIAGSEQELCKARDKIPAALSIGRQETFGPDNPLAIESHLLTEHEMAVTKFSQLAGRWLAMEFVERIRNQQKFRTADELAQQIAKDCEKAKQILATESKKLINWR